MAKKAIKKKIQNVLNKKKANKEKLDPSIEEVYEQEVTFMCPIRGLVKQKVKIKKYKSRSTDVPVVIGSESDSDLISKIDEKDDGLSIYSEEELKEGDDI